MLRALERELIQAEAHHSRAEKGVQLALEERSRLAPKLARGVEVPRLRKVLADHAMKVDEAKSRLVQTEDLCQ